MRWQDEPFVILAEGHFDRNSKTTLSLLRYAPAEKIVGVIDSSLKGKSVQDIAGFDVPVPILESLEEALDRGAKSLVIGVSLAGGKLDPVWIPILKKALQSHLNIIHGLHRFLEDLEELSFDLQNYTGKLIEYRKHAQSFATAKATIAKKQKPFRLLSVGTDCNLGKMTSLIEVEKELQKNHSVYFFPTGQTGMMLYDGGICIDSLVSDFVSGEVEKRLMEIPDSYDCILVEGQGGIIQPAFSGATIGLLHGVLPNGLLLCHRADRTKLKYTEIEIPDLDYFIRLYEMLLEPFTGGKVLGISINTSELEESDARSYIVECEKKFKLPCDDPVRFGSQKLTQAIIEAFKH